MRLEDAHKTPTPPFYKLSSRKIHLSKEKREILSSEIRIKEEFERERGVEMGFLRMETDQISNDLLESDLRELGIVARKLADHAFVLGSGLGFGTTFFKFLASIAAIYLLIVARTKWKTNMLTSLLFPYIFLSLPSVIFSILSGEVSKWITFIAILVRLFFPRHVPDWSVLPESIILLVVVSPSLFADTIRNNLVGVFICLFIACYLLQEHIRASGGFRNSFTQSKGVSNTIGIILIMVYPVWCLVLSLL